MKRKLFHIFILLLCIRGRLSENQYFRVKPVDREAIVGENVEFHCHVGNREGDVQWSKEGFLLGFDPKIPGYPRYFMEVDESQGVYNLRIQNVDINDEGEYQCQVGPAFNHTPIRTGAHLRILIAPSYISINGKGNSSVVEVKQNITVRLRCETHGSRPTADLRWFRNNTEINDDSVQSEAKEEKRKFLTIKYLSIRPTIRDNGSKLACEATHRALSRSLRAQVTLSVLHPPGKPWVIGYQAGDIVKAGDALTLTCVTRGGNPSPELIWYRGNAQIDASYYPMSDLRIGNNLTLTITAQDNGGSYHCQASNAAVRDSPTTTIKLSVYHLASKLRIEGPTEAARGDTIALHCSTDVSNPKSRIKWYGDGKELGERHEQKTIETSHGWITTSNLTITLSRQEPDVKTFVCLASNSEVDGTVNITHQIRVASDFADPPNTPTILGYDAGSALKVGDIQRFNCVALGGNPPATIRWFKGENELSAPVVMSGTGVSSEILIRVQLSDNGAFYRCEAQNPALRKPMSAFVRLTVHFAPTYVNLTMQPQEARSGDNVTLTCTSGSSNPLSRISWKKDGSFLREHREETMASVFGGISTRSRLSYQATSSDDGSLFSCHARNDIFKSVVTKTMILRVRHKPIFKLLYQAVEVEERQSRTINISAEAYPELVAYTWFRDGKPMLPGSPPDRISTRGSVLYLRNASREDSGYYHCRAENEEGSSNATVVLNVLYGTTIVNLSRVDLLNSIVEGKSVSFECTAEGNPVKEGMIKWKTKGSAGRWTSSDGGRRSILKISNVSREIRGFVECLADNGVGEAASLAMELRVLYRPMVRRNVGHIAGNTGRLKCGVDGTGNITVLWYFNGSVIRSTTFDRYHVTLTRQSESDWISMLTITNVHESDYGYYTCTASNSIGQDSAEIYLSDQYYDPFELTTALTPRTIPGRFFGPRFFWIPAAAAGLLVMFMCCILILCCLRKRSSNRTSHEGCRSARHIDIGDLTADEVCNKLLLSADVKSILLCASEKQHIPLQDFKEHSVFTIEDAYTIDKTRCRHFTKGKIEEDEKRMDVGGLGEGTFEEAQLSFEIAKDDCPDILRNERGLCLSTSKENGEGVSLSGSPDSPRFASTPSGSTGSCLSVYHEKVPLRSLGSDIENPDLMKLHPIMVLGMGEEAFKFPES